MATQRPPSPGTLWFSPPDRGPDDARDARRTLTRERVVAQALAVISADGAQALSMRALATRLGVVPGALYRHVRGKEQLYDLALDAVLAEIDCRADPDQPWAGQVTALAHRLRAALESHPGTAALLKTRDPLGPASLTLAEAFLASLLAAPMPAPDAARAFRLIYDYALGFALADPGSPAEHRIRDPATRRQLHAFLRSLPSAQFPALAAHGTRAWEDDRDQRFAAGLRTIIRGLQSAPPQTDP